MENEPDWDNMTEEEIKAELERQKKMLKDFYTDETGSKPVGDK